MVIGVQDVPVAGLDLDDRANPTFRRTDRTDHLEQLHCPVGQARLEHPNMDAGVVAFHVIGNDRSLVFGVHDPEQLRRVFDSLAPRRDANDSAFPHVHFRVMVGIGGTDQRKENEPAQDQRSHKKSSGSRPAALNALASVLASWLNDISSP